MHRTHKIITIGVGLALFGGLVAACDPAAAGSPIAAPTPSTNTVTATVTAPPVTTTATVPPVTETSTATVTQTPAPVQVPGPTVTVTEPAPPPEQVEVPVYVIPQGCQDAIGTALQLNAWFVTQKGILLDYGDYATHGQLDAALDAIHRANAMDPQINSAIEDLDGQLALCRS
jgi:hypothetical protein